MAETTSVLVNISDMIDLAIGTPEVGVVDFNMLQTVLHCLAQQLRILGKHVELRGSVAALPILGTPGRDNVQTIAISEYVVDTEDENKGGKPKKVEKVPESQSPDTILVVERVKKSESPSPSPRAASPPPRTTAAPPAGARRASTTSSKAPRPVSSTDKLSLVTISKFNLLENTVEDLRNRVYGSMPKNEAILEEVRSQTNLKAITDMWTNLNVSSRLEAAEAGIAKLSSLVQDLIAENTALSDALKKMGVTPTVPSPSTIAAAVATGGETATKDDLAGMLGYLDRLRGDLDHLSNTFYGAMKELNATVEPPSALPPPPLIGLIGEGKPSLMPTSQATTDSQATMPAGTGGGGGRTGPSAEAVAGLVDKINALEKQLKVCCENVDKKTGQVQDELNALQDQVEYLVQLQHQKAATGESDLAEGKLSPDLIKDLQCLMRLFQTVQDMQDQLQKVHETALQLAAEKEDRQHHVDALLEQIELLKTVKLDREDMAEAMADKADLRMLARKVSHDQFEMACDDLSRGLEHALGKLNMQEALWQQALDDIQREIETKLDKMELSPVKDFFNNKLKQLQENLKQMALLRREAEAAGTKRKLLRDVNCISCDAKAVMNTEAPSSIPVSKPLPAQLSMKPYLSYELDAIRKSQASQLPQRNMHDWETIDKQMTIHKPPQKVRSDTDRHMCNRYCGGSHTVTTPAQRVARLGHFIKQWGPDVLPLSSGFAAGDDGRMYRVNPTEGVAVGPGGAVEATCLPKSPKKRESKVIERTTIISNECPCLEGEHPGKSNY